MSSRARTRAAASLVYVVVCRMFKAINANWVLSNALPRGICYNSSFFCRSPAWWAGCDSRNRIKRVNTRRRQRRRRRRFAFVHRPRQHAICLPGAHGAAVKAGRSCQMHRNGVKCSRVYHRRLCGQHRSPNTPSIFVNITSILSLNKGAVCIMCGSMAQKSLAFNFASNSAHSERSEWETTGVAVRAARSG